jgi:hypothetical protein
MKFGPIDGNYKEVRDLLVNHGLNLADYIEKPPAPLRTRFIVIPVVVFSFSLLGLALLPDDSPAWPSRVFYILSFGSGTWICAAAQLRFRNGVATFCVAVGLVLTFLLAAGSMSPREAADAVRSMRSE